MTGPDAQALARRFGTPFYLYDLQVLRARVRAARAALPGRLLYAMKANPHVGLLRSLQGEVDGVDIASHGELGRALDAGWAPSQLSFVGPGKTPAALEDAVARGVLLNVESVRELDAVAAAAQRHGRLARVRLRINSTHTPHAYRLPMTGGPSPFGIDEETLPQAARRVAEQAAWVAFEGLHVHPGAQCTSVGGFCAAAAATLTIAERCLGLGLRFTDVNFGGGFGVLPEESLNLDAVGQRLRAMLAKFERATGHRVTPVFELGRWLVGPAGVYVARVVSTKRSRGTHFVVLDGGMNHHLSATGRVGPRPALLNLTRPDGPTSQVTVVGPLCTPLDTLAEAVALPTPCEGDLLGFPCAGAYGYSFSPLHFLGHPLPNEVLRRELGDDLL